MRARQVRAVAIGRLIDAAEDRLGCGATAVHRLRDAFALQRIHQTGGVADEEARDRAAGVVPTSPILSHAPSGRAGDRAGRASAENADARRVFEERVEVARGASARGPVGEHADTEADVRAPSARGKHPAVTRESLTRGSGVHNMMCGTSTGSSR